MTIKLYSSISFINYSFEYETETAIFKSEELETNNINGATYDINASLNYTVIFPNGLFDSSFNTIISVNSIKWKVNPIQTNAYENYDINPPVISLSLVDNVYKVISIDSKQILLSYPSNNIKTSLKDQPEWLSYNLDLNNYLIKKSDWEITITELNSKAIDTCQYWDKEQLTTIISTHLSSFTSISNISKEPSPK